MSAAAYFKKVIALGSTRNIPLARMDWEWVHLEPG
ncbi:hypothetical protein RSAG8_09487, partial [Rhizoctonia solani AG-8 WAC10335]